MIQRKLFEALTVLGASAQEVAGRLQAMGYTGRRDIMGDCPVARYLRETVRRTVVVGSTYCQVDNTEFPLPEAVQAFVHEFDAGKHPTLVDAVEHEPACPRLPDQCCCER